MASYRSGEAELGGAVANLAIALAALLIVLTIYALVKAAELVAKAYAKDPRNPALIALSALCLAAWTAAGLAASSLGSGAQGASEGAAVAVAGGVVCTLLLLLVAAVVV